MRILQLLSQVNDVKDFRIKDILGQIGLDERQASRFYHELIKEAREALSHIAELEKMTKEGNLLKERLKTEQAQDWRNRAINSLTKIKELEKTLQEQEQLLDSRFDDLANLSGGELDILIAYLKGLHYRRLREEIGRRTR